MHRHRLRSLLTIASVAISFLVLVLALQNILGLRETLWQAPGEGLIVVVLLVCLFVWRLRDLDPLARAEGLRRFALSALFVAVLAAPLAAQLAFLGRSAAAVAGQLAAAAEQNAGARVLAVVRGFPAAYEDYLKREFRLPHWFVQLNALVKVHLLRVSPNNNIALGTDGFYFEGMGTSRVEGELVESFDNIADYMGQAPFTGPSCCSGRSPSSSAAGCSSGAANTCSCLPRQAFVYPEHLPASLRQVRGRSRYEQLSSYLREHADIPFIDLLPPLLSALKDQADYPLLFYKTDFHWNFYGAFVAYRRSSTSWPASFPSTRSRLRNSGTSTCASTSGGHTRASCTCSACRCSCTATSTTSPWCRGPAGPTTPPSTCRPAALRPLPAAAADHRRTARAWRCACCAIPGRRCPPSPCSATPSWKVHLFLFGQCPAGAQPCTVVNFPKEIFFYEQPTIVIQEILNMFIPPPAAQKPWRLGAHYVEEKFRRNAERVLLRREVAPAAAGGVGRSAGRTARRGAGGGGDRVLLWRAASGSMSGCSDRKGRGGRRARLPGAAGQPGLPDPAAQRGGCPGGGCPRGPAAGPCCGGRGGGAQRCVSP